ASADGSEDPLNGTQCDGIDSDLCLEGARSCSGGALVCSDSTTSTVDTCNGLDDDCDAASADGSEDPQNGTQCDGADSDLCLEGTRSCSAGALVCSDATSSTTDLCNGLDDDCDGASADGAEDPQNGTACDGVDADLCTEGTRSCVAGALACSDPNDVDLEVCNGLNDDCNAATADGSGPPSPYCAVQNGGAVNVASWACTSGACQITACTSGFANFDSNVANGCECATDSYATSCGSAGTVSVARGATQTMTGKVDTAGGSDYLTFSFTAPGGVGAAFHPRVELTNSGGGQYSMAVLQPSPSCAAIGCGVGGETSNPITVWEQNFNGYIPGPGCCSDSATRQASVTVQVYRTFGNAPNCTAYTVTATNP
ncbi:MAG: hypothetical protein HY908_30440, partial [Myxococcales bacterium]|nr:hypothetical protein [Myxococcales bacterium]